MASSERRVHATMCEVQAQRETLVLFVACTSWSSQVLNTGDIQLNVYIDH